MDVETLPDTIPQHSELPDTIPQGDADVVMEDTEIKETPLPDTIAQNSSLPATQIQGEAGVPQTKESLPSVYPLHLDMLDMEVMKKVVWFILKGVDIHTFGQKQLRSEIENLYGWPRKSLKLYKEPIREWCQEFVNAVPVEEFESAPAAVEPDNQPRQRKRKRNRDQDVDSGQAGAQPPPIQLQKKKKKKKKKKQNLLDIHPSLENNWDIYVDDMDGDRVYSVMLNQTDLAYNQRGHNKFYTIQLLQSVTASNRCKLICKWGRVGARVPQSSMKDYSTLLQGKAEFKKKFKSKTANTWGTNIFNAHPGKYVIVDVVMDDDEDLGWEDVEVRRDTSKLSAPLFDLIQMICSRRLAAAHLRALNIDVDRFPLGRLSADQIRAGYQILSSLARKLDAEHPDKHGILADSNKFYTLIPHNFGMSRPPPIHTMKHLRNKIQLLELLSDLESSSHILSLRSDSANVVDLHYNAMQCKVTPLENDDMDVEIIKRMVTGTHAPSHKEWTLDVQKVFALDRSGEFVRNHPFQCLPNHRLLWHGSRMSNFIGILSQGLRIAPKEAPRTGYMFGKGIYFADVSSKSAQYCHASRENPYGILLLADVALGVMHEKLDAEYLDRAPKYFHSVWGKGKMAPMEENKEEIEGSTAFCGPLVPSEVAGTSLKYNEFIVYDVGQVLLKYLVLVKFHFRD